MSDTHWPTDAQLEQATNHGIEYAAAEIANGNAEPQESPLSGEWADSMVAEKVAYNAGYRSGDADPEQYQEALNELADAWESGYNSTWASHLDSKRSAS